MSIDLPVLKSVLNGKEWAFCVWEPLSVMVVLGRSGDKETEVYTERCLVDHIPIYRRRTGGGTVVLSPGTLVFSLARLVSKPFAIKEYFHLINGLIIEFLKGIGVEKLRERGLSDVCIDEKKILGSGMYMSRKVLFFQGSLLVNTDISLMEKYLPLPPREPDYRTGRGHGDFVTTLLHEGYKLTAKGIAPLMKEFLLARITEIY